MVTLHPDDESIIELSIHDKAIVDKLMIELSIIEDEIIEYLSAVRVLREGPGLPAESPERVAAEKALTDLFKRTDPAEDMTREDARLRRHYEAILDRYPRVDVVAHAKSLGLLPTKESDHGHPQRAARDAAGSG